MTYQQIIRNTRKEKKRKKEEILIHISKQSKQKPQISNCPFKLGRCIKIKTVTPRKPNSANRKVARVELSNKKKITAAIPGEKHNLQDYAYVLVRKGGYKDTPGVFYSIVRGTKDAQGVENRKNGRSKYGVKRAKVNKSR